MKREEFLITSTAGHHVVKFAWNSANREVEKLIREIADEENAIYELSERTSEKSGKFHVSGVRVWTSKSGGKSITFFITKLA